MRLAAVVTQLLGTALALSNYNIRFRGSQYTVFPEGAPPLCLGEIPNSLGLPAQLCNNLVDYNPTYVDIATADTSKYSALNISLYDQLWAFGDNVVRAHLKNSHPNVQFVALSTNITAAATCSAVLRVTGPAFTCKHPAASSSAFVFTGVSINTNDQDYEVSVSILENSDSSTPAGGETLSAALTIGFARLQEVRDLYTSRQTALDDNSNRYDNARVVVGVFYFFLCLGVTIHALLSSCFTGWFKPLRKFSPPRNQVPRSILIWFCLTCTVYVILVCTAGLIGVCSFFCFLLLKDLVMWIGYMVRWHADPAKIPPRIRELMDLGVPPEQRMQARKDFREGFIFRYRPYQMSRNQKRLMFGIVGLQIVLTCVLVAIAFGWQQKPYYIWDRTQATVTEEVSPSSLTKTSLTMYAHPHVATFTKLWIFNQFATSLCETRYNKRLSSDGDKKQKIFDDFISAFNVDMTLYARQSYLDYTSVNDWFTRELASGYRNRIERSSPVDNVLVSPVYARTMAFHQVPSDQQVWVKDEGFTLRELIGSDAQAQVFENGAIAILRMNFQDYHRYHSPVDGFVSYIGREVGSKLMSVNMDAMQSENDVLYNKRRTIILATEKYGKIALVIVGATCVGSINLSITTGQTITKGDQIGFFAFGGSTVVLIVQPNVVTFDDDLQQNSINGLETKVELGMRLGNMAAV